VEVVQTVPFGNVEPAPVRLAQVGGVPQTVIRP